MHRIFKFWRQSIATTLIFVLLISQTVRVDFWSQVEASQEDYRDIVSIFVDTQTYRENRVKINRYAEDIQTYLGSTRSSVFVVDTDTSPAVIAAQNEKLYYEGDGEDGYVSRLIGTILIGDIAIPMVDTGKDQFPSVYPYVDFVDKKFLYNESSGRYIIADNDNQKIIEPEVWHGVINPAVGRNYEYISQVADPTLSGSVDIVSDIEKIDIFLDKTHDFYTQSGVFQPSILPPRVFYYDGFLESKSFAIEDLGAYEVYMDSAEEVIYNRFTKYFLKYVIGKVEEEKKKFNQEELAYIDSLGIEGTSTNMFPDEQVDKTPDILTKPMVLELLKKFHELINAKSLSDIRAFVRNAGRYNDGPDIRIDQPAINISLMDYAAMNSLRQINDKMEGWVDSAEVQLGFAAFIYDHLTIKEPDTVEVSVGPGGETTETLIVGTTRIYDNYLFGTKAATISDVNNCSIARGSVNNTDKSPNPPYKQSLFSEANSAFDVYTIQDSMELYQKDGEKQIDCAPDDSNQSSYETDSYWGKNIITNVNTGEFTFKEPSFLRNFYQPIFSFGGMKELDQDGAEITHQDLPLIENNPIYCNAAYSQYPYMLQAGFIRRDGPWPDDEGKSIDDISCKTEQEASFRQPTWPEAGVPPTRLVGQEYETHYVYAEGGIGDKDPSKIGACQFGQVFMKNISTDETPVFEEYTYACLPAEFGSMGAAERGETYYEMGFSTRLAGYIRSIAIFPPVGPCEGSPGSYPDVGVQYNTACPILGDGNVASSRVFGNYKEEYWTKVPIDGIRYPCIVGYGGGMIPRNINYPCVLVDLVGGVVEEGSGSTSEGGSSSSTVNLDNLSIRGPLDYTTYETQYFHEVRDSRVFHKSPTDEELAAAEKNNTTPSLAVDHDRHVTFMEESAANKDQTIYYPNIFRLTDELGILERNKDRILDNLLDPRGQERIRKYGSGAILITAYRLELDRLGKEEWLGSLESTIQPGFTPPGSSCWGGQLVGNPTCEPATIDGPLSDEDIATAIQANRWLNPDVTLKMRKAVETGLSYSREYGSGGLFLTDGLTESLLDVPGVLATITGTLSSPPKIATLTGGYDIAYLGLTDFIPEGGDETETTTTLDGQTLSDSQAGYTEGRNQISALNISEQEAEESKSIRAAASDSCGPPEGVDLFEWPSAIQCWIKSLTPIRIIGQACGINTIGLDISLLTNSVFPGSIVSSLSGISYLPPPTDTSNTAVLQSYYSGARLTYHIPRDVILPGESLEARFFYARGDSLMQFPQDTRIKLEVIGIQDIQGRSVSTGNASQYITYSPESRDMASDGTIFLIQSQNLPGTVQLRATLDIPAADGTTLQVLSDIIDIKINDEYLVVVSSVDDTVTSQISVASLTGMLLDMTVRNMSGTLLEPRYPIILDIYDDVSQAVTQTGIVIASSGYILPSQYTKSTGVYRLELRDDAGRHATHTIAVTAGPVAMASLSPISSALLKGSNTLVTLRLRDVFGNPISPDLHSIDLTAEGGYFIMQNGEKKNTVHIDAIEAEIPLTVGSDIAGNITIRATIDEAISTETELRVFESARVILSRTGVPEVGGAPIPVIVRVEDTDGNPLEGFRSIIHLETTDGGGVFAPGVAIIDNGISGEMTYTPGRLAGNQQVTAVIPGLGSIPDIGFSVNPGTPMYISHRETDTSLIFSLRDRYNNIVPATLSGTLEAGGQDIQNVLFSGGLLDIEKTVGYMMVDVPQLGLNTISFSDEKGEYTVRGISRYIAFVDSLANRFDFTEDYNARYTVLAGGSFLRESEDILYNTTPGSGQSLAVTTLLDTPYKRDTIFSILPGGGFDLGDSSDALPEVSVSLDGGYPLLTVRDALTNAYITQAMYRPQDPALDICSTDDCSIGIENTAQIELSASMTGITAEKQGDTIVLMKGVESLVTIMDNGMISHLPGVILEVDEASSQQFLTLDIVSGTDTLGKIIYKTDSDISLIQSDNATIFTGSTVYLRDTGDFEHEEFSQDKLADSIYGYRYLNDVGTLIYDDEKNAPEAIDSFGLTVESAGIGWKGSNRTLLSYAAGDTVGEATKWFHTYTMINLGDPVAHVDKKAVGTELDGIDRSIGTELTGPQASPVQSYAQRDMDNDGYEDIVVLHTDGYVELLLNLGDKIRSRGNIAYIPDIIERGFSMGDFRNDGYADIVGVDEEGSFVILSNDTRQFTRTKVSVDPNSIVPIGVTQFRIRDMDNDGRDDIVYLTESGELSILYGTDTVGFFDKIILDATLGLTLSDTDIKTGGALYADRIPQVSLDSVGEGDGPDEALVWNEVYVPYRYTPVESAVDVDASQPEEFSLFEQAYTQATLSPEASQSSRVKNFIRSEYAEAFSIDINKRYALGSGSVLKSGERITVDIDIRNTGTTPLRAVEYLDTIPAIFTTEKTLTYRVKNGANSTSSEFVLTSSSDYDTYFTLPDIPAGQTVTISYDLTALPTSYGELLVGNYEQGETGVDDYGDVGFSTDTTCGADMILWRSEDIARTYTKGTRSFSDMRLPPAIAERVQDADGDGLPDSLGNIAPGSQEEVLASIEDRKGILDDIRNKPGDNATDESLTTQEIADMAKEISDALACGYGGGGCMNFPINWAPLAPGNDPVVFGYPLGDGLRVDEGIPIFSSMTRMDFGPIPYVGCFSMPSVWPLSPLMAEAAGNCWTNTMAAWTEAGQSLVAGSQRLAQGVASSASNVFSEGVTSLAGSYLTAGMPKILIGAGGYLGVDSPSNQLRIYATPTLTLGVGAAICFGGTARVYGGNPSPGLWPLAQVGNCIVLTDSLNMCKDDGSAEDGDIRDVVALGTVNETWNAGNGSNAPGSTAGSCSIVAKTQTEIQDQAITRDIISYARSPDKSRLPSLYTSISQKTPRTTTSGGPLLSMGGASPDGALASVSIEIDTAKPLTASNIIKLDNKRIAGFPDFIMDWVSRQTDELVTAFFTPPSLVIIPPTSIGQNNQYDGTLEGLTDSFKQSYEENGLTAITQESGKAYDSSVTSQATSTSLQSQTKPSRGNAQTDLGKWMQQQQNSLDGVQDEVFQGELGKLADKGKGGISAIRAAYKLIGKLPLISISERTVPVDVPWILPQELDRYARSLDAYKKEVDYTLSQNCVDVADQSACLNQRANAGPLIASINQNLKRIEEYKNFPVKLQKYITWKQRYLSQILCYVTEVQQMSTGWLKDNSIRFRKWAELYVLIKTIADSWQPILDIIVQKDATCSVCHNERYNAKYWKYKLISLLIPTLPVIKMPRWPDIILDLSDVRLGIVIAVPNFEFNLKPIRLPSIPSFSLPNLPGATIAGLDLIPPLPDLPDLPDLPAIPKLQLPNLPPPPKLPKILSELKGVIDILKLWRLLECYLNKTPFVPEWSAGDIIAQRTERQGTNPLDFIDISLPQISIPTIQEIRVSSHVNFEVRSDFITEFARSAVAPLNEFNADLGRGIPKKIAPDININSPESVTIDLQSYIPVGLTGSIAQYVERLERDKDVLLDTDEFTSILKGVIASTPELAHLGRGVDLQLEKARQESNNITDELIVANETKYNLLKDYIQVQYDETANMQHIIDLLTEETHILAAADIERAQMVSETLRNKSGLLAQEWNQRTINSIRTEDASIVESDALSESSHALTRRVQRLAADISGASPSTAETEIAIASGYSPNFEGIYIVTSQGTQTRLFDYTESLQSDDESSRVDIDKDGDMDYLFILDGALFLKRTSTYEVPKIIDTRMQVSDLDSSDDLPIAPNFFIEDVSLPNSINFSYQSAQDVESIWRTTLYDRYLEWDMVDRGEHDSELTPTHIVEVLRSYPGDTSTDKVVVRSLDRVEDPDSIIIEGPRMEVLEGPMEFVLSPGRILYAGKSAVTILYGTGSAEPTIEKRIPPYTGYTIPDIANVTLDRGILYIMYPSIIPERYEYSDRLIGMPIVPGMRISTGGGEVTLVDHIHDEEFVLSPDSLYHLESSIRLGTEYSIGMDYPNGFYQARIQNTDTQNSTRAGELLLTPQLSSDSSAPDVSISDSIRVPVYQETSLLLDDIITDTNPYTLLVDTDITQDTDGNGIYDDDFVASALGMSVTDTSITFGPYNTLGNKNMMFRVTDEFHNTTFVPVTIRIYSPIPTIESSLGTGAVRGGLSESLEGQPVDIFRVRAGSDILRVSTSSVVTQSGGVFQSPEYVSGSGVQFVSSGQQILFSEKGITAVLPLGYRTQVSLATGDNPLSVTLLSPSSAPLYRQIYSLPSDTTLVDMSRTAVPPAEGLLISPASGYRLISASLRDPSIPGGVYMVDSENVAVSAIARDGNIYAVGGGTSATFGQKDGYPEITLRAGDIQVGEILYKFDFFYTLK